MAFSIKSDEADALARELVGLTGETLTTAVTEALRERLERHRRPAVDIDDLLDRLQHDLAAAPVLDERTDEAILGYDDHGIPT